MALTFTMCTSVHEHTWCHVSEHDEHVYTVMSVHENMDHVSVETWIPNGVVHGTLAQSGAQTINTFLQHTNIIFND